MYKRAGGEAKTITFIHIMEWYAQAGGFEYLEEYNCQSSNRTIQEWYARGHKDMVFGTICLIYGILIELIYIPCLSVITRPVYLKMSCYKIMTILGVIDMCAIMVNSVLTGYLLLEGAVFCTNPRLIYFAGAVGLGMWCAACASCLILVCNRLIELWKPYIMDSIFGGYRTYIIMSFAVAYGAYFTLVTPPVLFSSQYAAWFFSPFIYDNEEFEYYNIPHTLNNIFIVVFTCLLYSALCVVLANKFKTQFNTGMSWNQKSIFIQATAICTANLIASMVYVYMQFFPTANVFIIIGHICWQFGHGFPAIVYLAINRTVQREVLKMMGINMHKLASTGKTAGISHGNLRNNSVAPGSTSKGDHSITHTSTPDFHV